MNCNILLLGQTGVGKSALLNYLAGETLAESGVSTQKGGVTRGLHKYSVNLNGQECLITDSEGLELTNEKNWRKTIEKELFSESNHNRISSWYHIILFCIGANSARVQDYELNLIDKIIENNYGVIVAFTKADLATEDELNSLMTTVTEHFEDSSQLILIPVCSKQRRNNKLEGKEELSEAIINSWELTLLNRLPGYIYNAAYDSLPGWYENTRTWLANQKIGLFHRSKSEVLDELNKKIQKKLSSINSIIKRKQTSSFKEIATINESLKQVINYNSILSVNSSLTPRIEKLESAFVFSENQRTNLAVLGGLAAVSFMFPLIGAMISVGYAVKSILGKSPVEELMSSLAYQYITIFKTYSEKELLFDFMLADTLGYYYGRRELAICYLKGFGIEKNISTFNSMIKDIETILNNLDDGKGEYYLAYYYYSRKTDKDTRKAKQWLKKAVAHGYEPAITSNKFGDVFAKMNELEEEEKLEWESQWYTNDEQTVI